MKIACIGEAMIEVALTGQTGAARVGFAGDVLNTAIYLRRALPAVHEVAFVSMIGRDSLSDQMATFIAAEGISIAHLSRHPTLVPGLYTIATDALGERSFAYWRDTSAARQMFRDPAALQPLLGFDFIYLSAITLAILPDPARQALFEDVYLAVPVSSDRGWKLRYKDIIRLCRRLGLGRKNRRWR